MNALAAAHDTAVQMIDTSIVRVHQHGACITRNQRQSMGRSRGGLTSKIHALVDSNGLPVRLALSPGEAHDNRLADKLQHSGAIVKTIGDAVMAVFSRPTHAVSAALDILGEIERYNSEHGDPSIILKIGAHCGPSIAVTLNENLDYFGQTVNVAARVQSLAEAGEICISEALYSAPGVGQILTGLKIVEFDAPLRGVEGDACVYRVVRG
jgi:hypothetical protein